MAASQLTEQQLIIAGSLDPAASESDQIETPRQTTTHAVPVGHISETSSSRPMFSKQLTLYSSMEDIHDALPMPYKPKKCFSRTSYYFWTFLVTHPRIYALYFLYSATWPRALVLLDMYTDVAVAKSLFDNQETLWFMLSSIFVLLPFVLVWTVSLRFIQKHLNRLYAREPSKWLSTLLNIALILYIFPPIGALVVALYEVYWVLSDVVNGVKCFVLGTGFVETQTNEVRAMKQYRRAVEIFSESIPQVWIHSTHRQLLRHCCMATRRCCSSTCGCRATSR